MKYNLAYRYRVYPNVVQENLILQTFGCVRFVYNKILGKAKLHRDISLNMLP